MSNIYNKENLHKMYSSIDSSKVNFGVYHKCLFHLHTPESYDYYLIEEFKDNPQKYQELSDIQLFELMRHEQIIPNNHVQIDDIDIDISVFKTKKEYFSYVLIADSLTKKGIELSIITDHNTINGFSKLQRAIQDYVSMKKCESYPEICMGIEISCGDKLHVVGIFDSLNTKSIAKLRTWIQEHIMSPEDGTYLTSMQVLDDISSMEGIGYIAHIDTSNMFNGKYFSGSYKKKLLNLNSLNAIGFSNIQNSEKLLTYIKDFTNLQHCILVDSDSHSYDSIESKPIWVKGQKCTFKMIKKAIIDHSISFEYSKPELPQKYIKGISLIPGNDGFIIDKNNNEIVTLFLSESLNCFIGGRGSGKSTTINMLELILGQQVRNETVLNHLCNFKEVLVSYSYKGKEYLIHFVAPKKEEEYDNILKYFNYTEGDIYTQRVKYNFNEYSIRKNMLRLYLSVYAVIKDDNEVKFKKVKTESFLEIFFKAGYSINELVQNANSGDMYSFINAQLSKSNVIKSKIRQYDFENGILTKDLLLNMKSDLEKRTTEIDSFLKLFNAENNNKLRIKYSQLIESKEGFSLKEIYGANNYEKNKFFHNYNIRHNSVISYLEDIVFQIGPLDFFVLIFEEKFSELNNIIRMTNYKEDLSFEMINSNITDIDESNYIEVFKHIKRKLLLQSNQPFLIETLNKYLKNIDDFDLEFNINNKENISNAKVIYKSIKELSLGQKVIALLSFIISFGEYVNDDTPLIIDQPEDNLDNRYIYKNLVNDLIKVRSKRQVIIATHSSTIVTNSRAEQVIVMQSDGCKGWVEAKGYPSETNIIKHLLTVLEGGIDSFNHKSLVYSEVIKK